MLKISHTAMIVISGLVWLAVGCMLLPMGLNFMVESILQANLLTLKRPLLDSLAPLFGGLESALLVVIAICLFIGYAKGRYVFAKTVRKSVERILTLPNPVCLSKIYTPKYYLLLGGMVFLGFLARLCPLDIRGAIDVIIGSALINGAMMYFRYAVQVYGGKGETPIR